MPARFAFPAYRASGPGQHERVAGGEWNERPPSRKPFEPCLSGSLGGQQRAADEVGAAACLDPSSFGRASADPEPALLAPYVGEHHLVAGREGGQPVGLDGQEDFGIAWEVCRPCSGEPGAGGCGDPSKCVVARAKADDLRTRLDRAGAKLRPRKVDQDRKAPSRRLRDGSDMRHHRRPCGSVVVRRVDPRAVHSGRRERGHKLVIPAGFGRQRDHDARLPPLAALPEQRQRAPAERVTALVEGSRRSGRVDRGTVCREPLHDREHLLKRRQNMRLAAAQRGEPKPGQSALELAVVVPTQHEVGAHVGDTRIESSRTINTDRKADLVAKPP